MTTTLAESGLSSLTRRRIKRLHALVFGPYKSGKTIMAHQMPNTRTIDFDDGMQSIEWAIKAGVIKKKPEDIVYETILMEGPTDGEMLIRAFEQVEAWIEDEDVPPDKWEEHCKKEHGFVYPQFWDTLIVDSMSSVNEASIVRGLKENDRIGMSKGWNSFIKELKRDPLAVKAMRMQDWGSARSIETKFVEQLRLIGKNLIVLCHEYTDTDSEGNTRAVEPLLIGGGRQDIPKLFDEVYYCTTKGTSRKPKWVFQTTPAGRVRCGSRLGCLDPEEEADWEAIKEKIATFYGVDPDTLWVAAHGSDEIEKEMEDELNEEGATI